MISSNRWHFSLKFLGSNHLSIPRSPPNLAYKKSNQLSFLSVDNPFPSLSHQKISFIFFQKPMEFSTFHPSSWHSFFTSPLLFPYHFIPENYVHWTETPESHIYSADLPGVEKEHIRVEVEDSKYLIIRTEAINESTEPARRSFMRKFQLPGMVDVNGISAAYEDGVLTVTVPRSSVRRGFFIEPSDISERLGVLARAA